MKWLSAHIFYAGDRTAVLTNLVQPFVLEHSKHLSNRSPFFFIRYNEDGNHIRFRLCSSHHELLINALTQATDIFFKNFPNHPDQQIKEEKISPTGAIKFIAYTPEVERYGNQKSMPWAESYFYASSAFILKLICDGESNVFINAIKLHLILFKATKFNRLEMIELCESFINDWLVILLRAYPSMNNGSQFWYDQFDRTLKLQANSLTVAIDNFLNEIEKDSLTDSLNIFNERTCKTMSKYVRAGFSQQKLWSIMKSFMHMNHNRLGIDNHEEAYLVYCISQCIKRLN